MDSLQAEKHCKYKTDMHRQGPEDDNDNDDNTDDDAGVACLPLIQSTFMNIMFAPAVLCSSGPVPRSVLATYVEANPADDITVLVR